MQVPAAVACVVADGREKARNGMIEVSTGRLRGMREGDLDVFRGIPFARPPIGPLRFAPPAPPERWDGVRDATHFGPGCHQANRPLAPVLGIIVPEQSEDCLTLNVWTPSAERGARRPVMVWVHGGAWVIGAGSEPTYDGAGLARRGDVVVVTINYRLGPFGFLRGKELGLEATGNEGILDVIRALEWVRDEIAAFGGDPGNVTVFGNSAGSVNIGCLLASTRGRGLFHKAILQSGALNLVRSPEVAIASTKQILQELGLAPEQVSRLRELPANDLMAAQNAVAGRSMLPPFSPVADGDVIPKRPLAAIAAGSARGVPLIVGTNLEEMKLYRFLDPTIDTLDEDGLAARCAMVLPGADGAQTAAAYRAARTSRGDAATPAEIWLAISTDHLFRAPALKIAEAQARHTPDVFVYELGWKGTTPGKPQGAIHAMELPFVFGTLGTALGLTAGDTPAAHALSDAVQDAWLGFARTGRPKSAKLPDWPPYDARVRATLALDARCSLANAPREAERALWDALLEKEMA